MAYVRSASFVVAALLLFAGAVNGEEAKKPRTDLYGDPLPPGAVARLGMRPFPTVGGGSDLAFSADGKHLLSGDGDGQVRIWDAVTGDLRRCQRLAWKPREEDDSLEWIVLSPNGSRLAAWDRNRVYVYDTATGRELDHLAAVATDSFISPLLRFSPDSKTLLVQRQRKRSAPPETYLWDVGASNNGTRLKKLFCPAYTIFSEAAFTPDGRRVVGLAGNLRIWDTATGREVNKSDKDFPDASYLQISPDGKTLAVLANAQSRVDLLETTTLKKRATLTPPADGKDWYFWNLAFSPNSRLLAVPYAHPQHFGVLFWDVVEGKLQRRLSGVICVGKPIFSRDGKTLACRGGNRAISLLDVATGRQRNPRPDGHASYVAALAVSSDGRILASGDGAGEVHLWDAVTSKPLRVWWASRASIQQCWFSPDGKRLICLDDEGTVRAWEAATGKELWHETIRDSEDANGTAGFSADGKRLFLAIQPRWGETSIRLSVRDTETGKLLRRRSYESIDRGWMDASAHLRWRLDRAAFAPDGESMFGRQCIEEVATGRKLVALPGDVGSPAAFSPDGRCLVATVWLSQKEDPDHFTQKGLVLLEVATGEEITRWQPGAIDYVAFTPDGRAIVTANNEEVCVWGASAGQRWHRMKWPANSEDPSVSLAPLCLAVLPGGRIATGIGGMYGKAFIWDLAPSTWPIPKSAGDLDRKELEGLWSDLIGTARQAHRAIGRLATVPARTVPFLKDRLHPVVVDAKRIEKLLADLDSDAFKTREAATRELTRMRYRAAPMLRRVLEGKPSLEMRRRIDALLAESNRPPAEALRTLRAIAVLERIGTPQARRILAKLADGAAARETREAQAALRRLKRR